MTAVGGQRIENMEMEASFLIHFLGGLGHWQEQSARPSQIDGRTPLTTVP